MKTKPYKDNIVKKGTRIRSFHQSVDPEELVWHRDKENRHVKIIKSDNWKIQMENSVPVKLEEGKVYFIPKDTFHRVIKGNSSLILEIEEK